MSRIKIELPPKFIFSTEISLRISDINYGGHLGNDSVLSIFQEARIRFLNQFGYSEKSIEGSSIIMVDAAIQYKSQGFYGDVLIVELYVDDIHRSGCDLVYRATNKITGKEIARGKTGIVFFDYKNNKLVSVPEAFKKLIEELNS
ncbi:MAG: thioesterase family protein [Ignavibacteriaceae bacterium]|nr:thioesterase family protein [Ignavibacteriaceae bacterium]